PNVRYLSYYFLSIPPPPRSTLFPYTTLFRSGGEKLSKAAQHRTDSLSENFSGVVTKKTFAFSVKAFWTPSTISRQSVRNSSPARSEEHTSELQSPYDLVCRLLLEKKKKKYTK